MQPDEGAWRRGDPASLWSGCEQKDRTDPDLFKQSGLPCFGMIIAQADEEFLNRYFA